MKNLIEKFVAKRFMNEQMSGVNFLRKACFALLVLSIIFSGWSCDDEKEKDVKIKLSEDICSLCSSNSEHTFDNGVSIVTPKILTPNGDGWNDYFFINIITPDEEDFVISDGSVIYYNRDNKQIANLSNNDDLWGFWDCRVNGKFVESGLYSYRLTINGKEMEGKFIIVSGNDNYVDVCFSDTECGKNCLENFFDPALSEGSCYN